MYNSSSIIFYLDINGISESIQYIIRLYNFILITIDIVQNLLSYLIVRNFHFQNENTWFYIYYQIYNIFEKKFFLIFFFKFSFETIKFANYPVDLEILLAEKFTVN